MSLTPIEIQYIGRALATIDLERLGFVWEQNRSIADPTSIAATKGSEGRLIQVRTAVHPQEPLRLSQDETQRLKSKASQFGYEAWIAQITIDTGGKLAKTIIWAKVE